MEQKGGSLKRETGADDALGAVGDGAADEDDGGRDADDGRDGFDAPAEFRRELVERETEDDGNEHDLDGGNRHAHGVDVDDGAERQLANQRRHEDASHRGGGRHEHGQRDITLGDVRAQVARLSTVDGTDENQPREERPAQPQRVSNDEGQRGHERVAREETESDDARLGEHALEIINRERDPHGEHQERQAPRVRAARHEAKRIRSHHPRDGGQDGPNREQIGKDFRKLFKV